MTYTINFRNRSGEGSADYLNYVAQFDCVGSQLNEGGDPTNDDDYQLVYEAYVLDEDRAGFEHAIDRHPEVVSWSAQ